MMHTSSVLSRCGCAAVLAIWSYTATGQDVSSQTDGTAHSDRTGGVLAEITVSARKRVESAQSTPVPLNVVSEDMLDRYAVRDITSVVRFSPGLVIGQATNAVGGSISLRGIGSGDSSPMVDQAVSINVDGVQISTAQILRAAQFDVRQIEVLRGPQALFFGKNSPGGIISLTSADPGDRPEFLVRGGFEFEAEERFGEMIVSGPLTERVGGRLAARYSKMDGRFDIFSPPFPGETPYGLDSFPKQEEVFLRGTAVFEPNDRLKIRLKSTYVDVDMIGSSSMFSDLIYCPYGSAQGVAGFPAAGVDDCRKDRRITASLLPPETSLLDPLATDDPHGMRTNEQVLLTGDVSFDLTDSLNLTAVTGYYEADEYFSTNASHDIRAWQAASGTFNPRQLSQEVRLTSDFASPVNFMVGAMYERRRASQATSIVRPKAGLKLPTESTSQKHEAYSAFGQVIWDATERLEVSLGGRYSHEKRRVLDYIVETATVTADVVPLLPVTEVSFDDFSPELTLSFQATPDILLFGSYKQGFKSGGLDSGYTGGAILANPARGIDFAPEEVEGFEVGMKSSLVDGQVALNLTGYWYDYDNLQVSAFDSQAQVYKVISAARARVRGIEAETFYTPHAVPGLTLHLSGTFNDAKYLEYLADCYTGQTIELGCNKVLNPVTGLYTSQDLSGQQMQRAPRYTASLGVYYEFPVSDKLMIGTSANAAYTDDYQAGSLSQPGGHQGSFVKTDATIRFFRPDQRWEIALIGLNLTNKITVDRANDKPGTGSGKGGTTGVLSDIVGALSPPRQVMLQATYRY